MMLTSWWADSSCFSNVCFVFLGFLKNIFFVCDHETLSCSAINSLKPISNLIKNWCSSYKWFLLQQISASRLAKHNNHKQKSSMASNHNFSHSTIHDINRWVRSFDFSTKTNFIAYKLEGIKALRNVKIKWDFLRAIVKSWDPKDHVFWFKTAKLCPTIEEFFDILGYDPSKKSMAVSCDPRHRESLFDALSLPTSITSSMVEGHMVNLCAIVSRLINKCTYKVTDNMQKNFGLALCFCGGIFSLL